MELNSLALSYQYMVNITYQYDIHGTGSLAREGSGSEFDHVIVVSVFESVNI